MSVIKVTRRPPEMTVSRTSLALRSFRGISRRYMTHEKGWQFVIEVFLFAILIMSSAWPIFVAAGALGELFQRSGI